VSSPAIGARVTRLGRIISSDHRTLSRQYFWLSLVAALTGVVLSLLMRVHIVWPEWRLPFLGEFRPETYLAFMTMHGTLMVFFVLSIAPQNAFGNLVLPEMIGARQMALPILNLLSLWLTVLSFAVMVAALLAAGGGPQSGWTHYPPLSAIPAAGPGQGLGMDLWLVSIAVFCLASLLGAINFTVTVLRMRAPDMTMMRLPLPVWSWFVTSLLTMMAFSVLLAAALLLFSDRHWGTNFYLPGGLIVNGKRLGNHGGSPLLWQHLFWFFGHPEVYIAILPGMGVTSHLLATFARKPVFGYRAMVYSTLTIAFFGSAVWGHHMFTSGASPFEVFAFSTLTMVVAIPSAVKVVNWLVTVWRGRIRFTTPLLFSIGFVSLFITGGLSGPILAQPVLDRYLHDTYFVVAHFHLIMGMAAMFAVFAATHYWFPKLSAGRLMNESLGRLHFWLTFVGAYATFLPMHFLGLAGHPRRYSQIEGSAPFLQPMLPLQQFITVAAIVLATAQLIFVFNVIWSWRRGAIAATNPWQSTTLEWSLTAPTEIHCGPYELGITHAGRDYRMQHEASN
jgi:cytochrome c oxidase subunit 1